MRWLRGLALAGPAALAATVLCCGEDGRAALNLGIPTTVQDSGLLDALLPEFERARPEYRLRIVAAGSGELLALGERGDLDVLLSHSPEAELRFMEAGSGSSRRKVMENDFVIVGPPSDPAGVRGMELATAALDRISETGQLFFSRGDDSGTHRRELQLRAESNRDVGPGYREVGGAMGTVLRAASEVGAYALSDEATFLNLGEGLDLEILVEGDPKLLNIYHVIVTREAREGEGAQAFARWLLSPEGQRVIAAYGTERFGAPLYRPAR